jgi:hypothetical protein
VIAEENDARAPPDSLDVLDQSVQQAVSFFEAVLNSPGPGTGRVPGAIERREVEKRKSMIGAQVT